MRTKRAKNVFTVFTLLTLILSMLLSSCAEQPDTHIDTQGQPHNPSVQRCKEMAEYGDYIYYSDWVLLKYNKKTGVSTRVCQDPDCEGKHGSCLLDGHVTKVSAIVDDKLFFYSMTKNIKNRNEMAAYYAYLDLPTNEVVIMREGSTYETATEITPLVDGGYVYYTSRSLKPGGDQTNSDDYLKYAYRYEISSGKEEQLFRLDRESNEKIEGVTATHLITYAYPDIYKYELSTGKSEILFNARENDSYSAGFFAQMGNELYFCAEGSYDDGLYSEYVQKKFPKSYLFKMNLDTGKIEKVIEDSVHNYAIDGGCIYYVKSDVQHLYIPDDYKEHPEKVKILLIGDTLYSCDLNGENSQALCHLPGTNFARFTVMDGQFYGFVGKFDYENHQFGYKELSTIDFSTGEITPATVEE